MPSLQFYLLAHLAWLFLRKILALSLVQSFKKKKINKGYCCSRYSKVKGRKTKMNTKEKNNKKQKTCCVVNFFDVRGFLIWNKQQKLTFFGINWVFGIFTTLSPPPTLRLNLCWAIIFKRSYSWTLWDSFFPHFVNV